MDVSESEYIESSSTNYELPRTSKNTSTWKKRFSPRDVLLIAFDVEATGSLISKNAIIELSAIAMTEHGDTVSFIKLELQMPSTKCWDPLCLLEVWEKEYDDPDKTQRLRSVKERVDRGEGTDPVDAMTSFVEWMNEMRNTVGDPSQLFILYDSVFDVSFINYYLSEYVDHSPLHLFFEKRYKEPISIAGVSLGLCSLNYKEFVKTTNQLIRDHNYFSMDMMCRQQLKICDTIQPSVKSDHNSLNDSINMLQEHLIQVNHAASLRAKTLSENK